MYKAPVHFGSRRSKNQAMNLTEPHKGIFMSLVDVHLKAVDGVEWRFAYTVKSVYLASITSGSCSLCSPHLTHDIQAGQVNFSVYLANAYINFPITEFKKFKEFLQRAKAAKAAA